MKKIRTLFKLLLTQSLVDKSVKSHTCRPGPVLPVILARNLSLSCPTMTKIRSMSDWSFSDPKLASLPLDPEPRNYVRQVGGAVFSCVPPTPWTTPPVLVSHSQEALDLLDMEQEITKTKEFLDWVAGNVVLPGSIPMAHR